MKKLNLLFVLILGLIVSSCGNTAETVAETTETTAEQETATTEDNHDAAGDEHAHEATTNTGVLSPEEIRAKIAAGKQASSKASTTVVSQTNETKLNANIAAGYKDMKKMIEPLMVTENITLDMYKEVGNKLDKVLNTILKTTTIKGAKKEKLDEILLSLTGMAKILREKDKSACEKTVKDIGVKIKSMSQFLRG